MLMLTMMNHVSLLRVIISSLWSSSSWCFLTISLLWFLLYTIVQFQLQSLSQNKHKEFSHNVNTSQICHHILSIPPLSMLLKLAMLAHN